MSLFDYLMRDTSKPMAQSNYVPVVPVNSPEANYRRQQLAARDQALNPYNVLRNSFTAANAPAAPGAPVTPGLPNAPMGAQPPSGLPSTLPPGMQEPQKFAFGGPVSSMLGGLGKSLLGGILGGGGGGLSNMFSNSNSGGNGLSNGSYWSSGNNGNSGDGGGLSGVLGGLFNGIKPMLPQLAGMAGGALGTFFGGPAGGMIGGSLGGSLGDALFGGNNQQQQQGQMQPGQSFGGQAGGALGNYMNQGLNQYLPSNFQNQNFGNIGSAAGEYFGGQFGHPNVGRMLGGLADQYMAPRMPQDLRNTRMGDFGTYAGNRFGNEIDSRMQGAGINPYYGGVPMAPDAGDLYSRAPGGSMGGYGGAGGGYSIPQAPNAGDIFNRAPGGFSGGYSRGGNSQPSEIPMAPTFNAGTPGGPSSRSFPMQEQSGRGALLSDIRNYRRPSYSAPANDGYSGYSSPQAPDSGDLFNRAPGAAMRSSMHPSAGNSIFNEFQQRASQPGMGLRPTETRATANYPANNGNSMMDMLRNSLSARRGALEPEDPYASRGYTVRGGY